MKTIEVIDSLCDCANDFIKAYKNEGVEQKIIDAIIVDFVNYFSAQYCVDLAMYTSDLRNREKRSVAVIDKQSVYENGLLTIRNKYNSSGIIKSINRNSHMNDCYGNAVCDNSMALNIVDAFIAEYMKEENYTNA